MPHIGLTNLRTLACSHARTPSPLPPCPQALGLYAVLPDAAWVRPHGARRRAHGAAALQSAMTPPPSPRRVQAAVQAAGYRCCCWSSTTIGARRWPPGAYGAHLEPGGSGRTHARRIDELRAGGLRLGVSTHGYAEMLRADAASPSYIAMGAVFPDHAEEWPPCPRAWRTPGNFCAPHAPGYPQVAMAASVWNSLARITTAVGSIAVVRAW